MWDSVSGSRAVFIFPTAKPSTAENTKAHKGKKSAGRLILVHGRVSLCAPPYTLRLMVPTSSSHLPKRAYAEPREQASKTYCQHSAARGCVAGLIAVVLAHEGEDADAS